MFFRFTLALVTFLVFAAAAPRALAQDTAPMNHAAIAASYDQEAKDAQAKVTMHEQMLGQYKSMPTLPKGSPVNKEQMVTHCQSLVDSYKATATQAADLAKAHRELAASAK